MEDCTKVERIFVALRTCEEMVFDTKANKKLPQERLLLQTSAKDYQLVKEDIGNYHYGGSSGLFAERKLGKDLYDCQKNNSNVIIEDEELVLFNSLEKVRESSSKTYRKF